MRGLTRLAAHPTPHSAAVAAAAASSSSRPYSTFAGGGGGGRGRGLGPPPIPPPPRVPGQPEPESDAEDAFLSPASLGRGRGRTVPPPLPSSPTLPPFPSFLAPSGRGRGGSHQPPEPSSEAKKPIFFRREEITPLPSPEEEITPLPSSLAPSSLSGSGRGKPVKPRAEPVLKSQEINRHLRARPPAGAAETSKPKLSAEEAVRRAREVLSRGAPAAARGGGRGGRGRGMGLLGRGRGGRGRGRARDAAEEFELYVGDNADGEKLEKRLGEASMNKLAEGFEELSWRVLPSPAEDAYLDALHTNNMIEYEPEYLMQFDTNPDIDEKPPMSLEEYLEKMKPFLMAYEGIQSQEEWEEIIKETMEKVPYMKELMDMYCGPDSVTAKQQQQELERVAKTLPENIPSSVKRFTDRALLSLQSNPGWGFDKKCQFMDKLVWEVSQHYK